MIIFFLGLFIKALHRYLAIIEIVMFVWYFKISYKIIAIVTLHQQINKAMKYYYSLDYFTDPSDNKREQVAGRQSVIDFLDGSVNEGIMRSFVRQICRIIAGKPEKWEICFVPADDDQMTVHRYAALAEALSRTTGVSTRLDSLSWKTNRWNTMPEFIGRPGDGRSVILIDAVVDSGRTINAAASALMAAGALSVTGLVAAKTANDNLYAA